jgi:DNA ligase-1
MPKQQSSLDSFFGVKNKQAQQKTLTSFFKKDKENKQNDDDDDDVIVRGGNKRESPTSQVSNKRRRQAIEDSEDDEEEPVPMKVEENKLEEGKEINDKESTTESPTMTPPSPSKTKEEPKEDNSEPEDDDVDDSSELVKQAKKLAKAAKVDATVDEISTPVLYQDLVETLEQIEAITSRLEIQAILTKLLRRTLQYAPKELYSVVYLASNSIAPAYECVELGIGDSILIKAIGEAYGTNRGK